MISRSRSAPTDLAMTATVPRVVHVSIVSPLVSHLCQIGPAITCVCAASPVRLRRPRGPYSPSLEPSCPFLANCCVPSTRQSRLPR